MATETKIRPEAKEYTSLSNKDEFGTIVAVSPEEAWHKSPAYLSLLIEGATAKAIGVRRVDNVPEGLLGGDLVVGEDIKKGDECTIVLDDPYYIAGARFRGKKKVSTYKWLAFEKGGIPFYVNPWDMVITYINGKRVGLEEG